MTNVDDMAATGAPSRSLHVGFVHHVNDRDGIATFERDLRSAGWSQTEDGWTKPLPSWASYPDAVRVCCGDVDDARNRAQIGVAVEGEFRVDGRRYGAIAFVSV